MDQEQERAIITLLVDLEDWFARTAKTFRKMQAGRFEDGLDQLSRSTGRMRKKLRVNRRRLIGKEEDTEAPEDETEEGGVE